MNYNIELTSEEIQVIKACLEFVSNGNIGFEAITNYIDEDINAYEIKNSLNQKFI